MLLDLSVINQIFDTSPVTLRSALTIKKVSALFRSIMPVIACQRGVRVWILMLMAHSIRGIRCIGKQEIRVDFRQEVRENFVFL